MCIFDILANIKKGEKQMKKAIILIVVSLLLIMSAFGCNGVATQSENTAPPQMEETNSTAKPTPTQEPKPVFTNKYGAPTTICFQSGCNNYIATSGDTNCCPFHSNTCMQCYSYCDGDALVCLSCLTKALNP